MKTRLLSYWHQFKALPGSDEPLLRWGLLLTILILVWALLFEPYQAWSDMRRDMLHTELARIDRLHGLQASAKAWAQADKDYTKAIEATRPLMFQAASYAIAQSALLDYLKGEYIAHHLTLVSQRLLDMEPVKGMGEQVAVYVRIKGKLADMLAFVDAAGQGKKLLLLDDLYIGVNTYGTAILQFKAVGFRPVGGAS